MGSTACLLSSIYANVERKRKDFAVLRLLGLHGARLGLFPLPPSLALTLLRHASQPGALSRHGPDHQHPVRGTPEAGEAFCTLGIPEQGTSVLVAVGLAMLARIAAARLASD